MLSTIKKIRFRETALEKIEILKASDREPCPLHTAQGESRVLIKTNTKLSWFRSYSKQQFLYKHWFHLGGSLIPVRYRKKN